MATKIEKTLELNITHELLSLADSFWWYVQPISLRRYWRPHWRLPLMPGPKSFATGLHINLEGKANGGYDVCIKSPSPFSGGNPRLLFMQFKAGVEKAYCSDKQSVFYGSKSAPNIHVAFDINSNTKKNQHKLLQDLASKAGNKDAVVYVFPRIVNETQMIEQLGSLLLKTSFVSVSELDDKAEKAAVKIDDGNPHKFRTCYHDYNKNEVNFFFFLFGQVERPGSFLGEIFAIRVYRALKSLQSSISPEFPPYRTHIMDAMIRHLINIANHFHVTREEIHESFLKYPKLLERFGYDDLDDSIQHIERTEYSTYGKEVYKDIIEALSLYLQWINEEEYFDGRMKIPEPPKKVTIEMPVDGLHFSIDEDLLDEENLSEITYQFI